MSHLYTLLFIYIMHIYFSNTYFAMKKLPLPVTLNHCTLICHIFSIIEIFQFVFFGHFSAFFSIFLDNLLYFSNGIWCCLFFNKLFQPFFKNKLWKFLNSIILSKKFDRSFIFDKNWREKYFLKCFYKMACKWQEI